MPARAERFALLLILLFAAGVFLTGIGWGLPSRDGDAIFFGSRTPWTGVQVQALVDAAGPRWDDPSRGADLDADPLAPSTQPTIVNRDDADRAQIVRRHRLFTHQPDEMITLMSLAKMRPWEMDFDPRLYQYGGLWIYPVGLLLKVASACRLIDLRSGPSGLAYYLDHPDAFARFYIVARCYVVLWGLIAVWAVFKIVRLISSNAWAAAGATLAVILMPVVVNMAHEAKPHLPGVALVLLAVLAAAKYVERGKLADAILAGALCGAAFSMVLSTLPVFSILLVMVLLRNMEWGDRIRVCIFSGLVGVSVYGVANPYVIYHVLAGGGALKSNLENSAAFYSFKNVGEGAANVVRLMASGSSLLLFLAGILGAIGLGVRAFRTRHDRSDSAIRRRAHGLLLATPAVLTAIQSSLVAAGKPGEFARFLLLTDIFLAVEAFAFLALYARRGNWTNIVGGMLLMFSATMSFPYLLGFERDSTTGHSRQIVAEQIETLRVAGGRKLVLPAEPAPYSAPPFNLFDWQVVVTPKGRSPDEVARPGDVLLEWEPGKAPISWADKPMRARVK